MANLPSSLDKTIKSFLDKWCCKFEGIKVDKEKNLIEIVVRICFLYFARNSIYIIISCIFFLIHLIYAVLILKYDTFWDRQNVFFGFAVLSTVACYSQITISRNELARFFDVSMDPKLVRASFKRTIIVIMQLIFGLVLALLSVQLYFTRQYSPYIIVLAILGVIMIIRLIVVIVILTNIAFRFGEQLCELSKFLAKCNGRSEYENLALRLKNVTLCLQLLISRLSTLLTVWIALIIYIFLLLLRGGVSIAILIFTIIPFLILFSVCCFINQQICNLKSSTFRFFELQFITPTTNSLISYFWISRKIEEFPLIHAKYLFDATYSNIFKLLLYCTVVFISYEPCIQSLFNCKNPKPF